MDACLRSSDKNGRRAKKALVTDSQNGKEVDANQSLDDLFPRLPSLQPRDSSAPLSQVIDGSNQPLTRTPTHLVSLHVSRKRRRVCCLPFFLFARNDSDRGLIASILLLSVTDSGAGRQLMSKSGAQVPAAATAALGCRARLIECRLKEHEFSISSPEARDDAFLRRQIESLGFALCFHSNANSFAAEATKLSTVAADAPDVATHFACKNEATRSLSCR